jgi:hypothetical protein
MTHDVQHAKDAIANNPNVPLSVLLAHPNKKWTPEAREYIQQLMTPPNGKSSTPVVESPLMIAALDCVARGWFVFALGERAKEPDSDFSPHGFNSSTNEAATVRQIWTVKPNANYGIDLGRSGLTVLDFDSGRPPAELNLPVTLQVSTSRGTHVYYAGTVKQSKMQLNGTSLGDVKSGGGYVLGPCCIHPSGAVYTVVVSAPVARVPLLDAVRPEKKPVDASVNGEKIPRGQHDNELHRIAGKLRGIGLEEEAIYDALVEICEKRCEDYGSDYLDMCRKHAHNSAEKYAVNPPDLVLNQQPSNSAPTPSQGIENSTEITPEILAKEFPAYDGTEPPELPMLVQGFMPKGVGFLGSLSGVGKTWVALSISKALTTGLPLWGVFPVKQKTAVLYLIPEASDLSFKRRLAAMRITQEKTLFRFRTITQGQTRPLSDKLTIAMVQELRKGGRDVLVVVDTAVRFFNGGDENQAKENNLVIDSDMLRSMGADVLFLHHSPKATKDAADLTLENTLRGSGDFGAMSDYVYGFRRDESLYSQGEGPEEVEVVCVKPRDFEPPLPFRLQFKRRPKHGEGAAGMISVIDETHDLRYIGNRDAKDNHAAMLATIFKENPSVALGDLAAALGIRKEHVKNFCKKHGWKQVEEMVPDAKGRLVKKRRWSNSLVMFHQVEVKDGDQGQPPQTEPGDVAANTISFEPATVPDEDPSQVAF